MRQRKKRPDPPHGRLTHNLGGREGARAGATRLSAQRRPDPPHGRLTHNLGGREGERAGATRLSAKKGPIPLTDASPTIWVAGRGRGPERRASAHKEGPCPHPTALRIILGGWVGAWAGATRLSAKKQAWAGATHFRAKMHRGPERCVSAHKSRKPLCAHDT